MINGLKTSIPNRLKLIQPLVTLALVCMLSISYKLWLNVDEFPRMVISNFHPLTTATESLVYVIVLLLLVASIFLKYSRIWLFLGLTGIAALCFNDFNRLQPWLVCTVALLIPFLFYNGRVDDANRYTAFFVMIQILISGIYFLNGFYLFNSESTGIQELIHPLNNIASERQINFMLKMAEALPFILMLNAVMLLIPALRYLSVTCSLVLHLLLIILIASGELQNKALLIFNLLFIPLVWLAFSGQTRERYFSATYLLRFPLFYVIMAAFIIWPLRNISQENLAFSPVLLRGPHQIVILPAEAHQSLSHYQRAFCKHTQYTCELNLTQWFRHERNGEPQVLQISGQSEIESKWTSKITTSHSETSHVLVSEY